jgi:hypothetical protein
MNYLDWENRLAAYLNTHRTSPFVWGINDCCLFACNCVITMTGTDPGKKYRGRYTTQLGATRALKRYGGGSIKTAFSAVFGPIKPRLNAGRGDLVLIDTEYGHAVGVLLGGAVWAVSTTGLVSLPLNRVLGCWQVNNMQALS